MGIFRKAPPPPPKPRERLPLPPRGAPGDGAISIIGPGMSVVGDITTEGIVRVEGHVKGTIRAGKSVVLGQGGRIDGDVFTDDAIVGGSVNGSVVATNRLEMQSTCVVTGEIRARPERLKLEEGARFAGHVKMLEDEANTSAPAGPPRLPAAEAEVSSEAARELATGTLPR